MITDIRELLILAARSLGELRDEVVFVGGATTGLLLTDPAAPGMRATKDIDVIMELASKGEYYKLGRQRDREDTVAAVVRRAHGTHRNRAAAA